MPDQQQLPSIVGKIEPAPLVEEIQTAFLDYAMSCRRGGKNTSPDARRHHPQPERRCLDGLRSARGQSYRRDRQTHSLRKIGRAKKTMPWAALMRSLRS